MSYPATPIVHAALGTGANGGTTSAVDTTGATLIVVSVTTWSNGGTATLSDSKSNTWTPLTLYTGVGGSPTNNQLFYCASPSVGSGHTFTLAGTSLYGCVGVLAFAGAHASPFDQEAGNTAAASSTLSPGSLTPSVDSCLVVSGLSFADFSSGGASIDAGFAETTIGLSSGNYFGGGIAYLVQGTAAAATPTWTYDGGPFDGTASLAVFKPSAGGGGGGNPWYAYAQL